MAVSRSSATASEHRFDVDINGSGGTRASEALDDLVWVVQFSDLHFSVHHPDRAQDFRDVAASTLAFVRPSLVLLTGDLTDGKSFDMLTMKQNEEEWVEYKKVMQEVSTKSGLDKNSFYDVRGNHDNFGVPLVDGPSDFFPKYSINGELQRNRKVNSLAIQTSRRKLVFVGIDSTMSSGLRGPTNVFGHPTDELLAEISSQLSQFESDIPVTKLAFGHFPLSFTSASESGRFLKDIFIKHSLDVYVCGHLHTKFGKNLKRYHHAGLYSNNLFQFNGHRQVSKDSACCDGFWEFEMGDWRKNRAMRILALDAGRISFVDVNLNQGAQKSSIILPTFPLDSRFSFGKKSDDDPFPSTRTIRALVFWASPVSSVVAKIYDSSSGNLITVLEEPMKRLAGSLYIAPWNMRAFEDQSPERYLLQVVATDTSNRSVASELRPFSVTGIPAKIVWSWKEFLVMGCQWDSLYYAAFWGFYILTLTVAVLIFPLLSSPPYSSRRRSIISIWLGMAGYLVYLVVCPWLCGQAFTTDQERLYMTYRGWVSGGKGKVEMMGSPDVMAVVLSHLCLVVFPAVVVITGLAAERSVHHHAYLVSQSSKKNDDWESTTRYEGNNRWFRKFLLAVTLVILWKHYKNCRALVKAFDMNPAVHFPVYSFALPLLLVYTIWN
ncbi:hypothetical protein M569_06798 [Genlisea aurea]|uniref:Uncharacterized protein n=1 Tax=Genlisea aurea TaxID=192259 RepID=S8E6G4_9LAMI|nr:hypothetical protein M569_06798 [Genlisea aurea]